MRAVYHATSDGMGIHLAATPGPKPLPATMRKVNVPLRLSGETIEQIARAATAAAETRQAWIEKAILNRLVEFRNTESA